MSENNYNPESVKLLIQALQQIAGDEGECCQRCEGNGKLWADGQAHLPSYEGYTIPCGRCGGEGRIHADLQQIAQDALESFTKANYKPPEDNIHPIFKDLLKPFMP